MVDNYSDGIDPDSCRHVRIAGVYFDGWDDAIVAKASFALGYRRSTENLAVTNCVLTTNSCYLKFGSESGGDFKNVAFTNTACYRRPGSDRRNLSVVDIESNDGANVDGVVVSNIVAQDVYRPFAIRLANRGRGGSPPGTIRNISISNFVSTAASVAAVVSGLPEHPVENLALDGVTITVRRPRETARELERFPGASFRPQAAYGLLARHVDGLKLANVRISWVDEDTRPAALFDNVRNVVLDGFSAATVAGSGPVLSFNDVADAWIQGSRMAPGTQLFLRLSGPRTERIRLTGNDLSHAARAWESGDGVKPSAVTEADNINAAPRWSRR